MRLVIDPNAFSIPENGVNESSTGMLIIMNQTFDTPTGAIDVVIGFAQDKLPDRLASIQVPEDMTLVAFTALLGFNVYRGEHEIGRLKGWESGARALPGGADTFTLIVPPDFEANVTKVFNTKVCDTALDNGLSGTSPVRDGNHGMRTITRH